MLGMIGFAQFVPLFLLTPITGLVADSVDRRWIVRSTTALLVLTAARAVAAHLVGPPDAGRIVHGGGGVRRGARLFRPRPIRRSRPIWSRARACPPRSRSVRSPGRSAPSPAPASAACSMPSTRRSPMRVATLLFVVALTFTVPDRPRAAAGRAETDHRPLAPHRRGVPLVRRNRLVQAAITLDLFAVLLAARPRCCRSMPATSCMSGRRGWGVLAAGMGIGAASTAIWFSVRPMSPQCRREDAGRRRRLRPRHPDFRPSPPMSPTRSACGPARCSSHDGGVVSIPTSAQPRRLDRRGRRGTIGVGLCPPVRSIPGPHPRCDARAGERGVAAHHLGIQRTGRVRERP